MTAAVRVRSLFDLDLPFHETMRLSAWHIGPEGARPRVGILAGIHGDEWNGPYLAYLLGRRLAAAAEGGRLAGEVVVIPAGNPLGTNLRDRFWPFDGMDLNRLFPGYAEGETGQRIAAAIFEAMRDVDYCLDLHTGSEQVREIPQVRLFEASHAFVDLARSFGFDFVWKRATVTPLVRTLFSYQIGSLGIPTFVVVCGTALRLDRGLVARALEGIWSFLERIEVVRPAEEGGPPRAGRVWEEHEVGRVVAEAAGFFLPERALGDEVAEGDSLGVLFDPIVPDDPPRPVRAAWAGRIVTMRVAPLVYEGMLLARIAKGGGA